MVCVVVVRELGVAGSDDGVDAHAPSTIAIHQVRILVVCHVMAWIKVPGENHALFHASLPKDPRISTVLLFGSVAALVNGNMFGGLFERSALVKLGEADYAEALALDGAEKFDPMRTGRVMSNTVVLPETVMDEPAELRDWMKKAFDYVATLPPKKKKGAKKPATKPATKARAVARPTKAATKRGARARAKARPSARK